MPKKIKRRIKYQRYLMPTCALEDSLIKLPMDCNGHVTTKCLQCQYVKWLELKRPYMV